MKPWLFFIRVNPAAFKAIEERPELVGTIGNSDDENHTKVMKQLAIKDSHMATFDLDADAMAAMLAQLGTDGTLTETVFTMTPAAVSRLTLPEALAKDAVVAKLFRGTAKHGDHMILEKLTP